MVLACECGSLAIKITATSASTDEDGYVTAFKEWYECEVCGETGTYVVPKNGSDHRTGCLTTVNGGGW